MLPKFRKFLSHANCVIYGTYIAALSYCYFILLLWYFKILTYYLTLELYFMTFVA